MQRHNKERERLIMMNSNNGNDNDNNTDMENGNQTDDVVGSEAGFLSSKISDVQFPLILVLASSIVLLIAVTTWEQDIQSRAYAISVPALTMCLSLGGILATLFQESVYAVYGFWLTHILFYWNFSGACFLTFSSPFTTTGNGYFAAWACVMTSAMAMGFSADAFKDSVKGLGSLMGLGASSGVVIIALIGFVGGGAPDNTRGESIYAMVVACFTAILVMGLMYFQKQQQQGSSPDRTEGMIKFAFLSTFAILWLVLACLVTFRGPFVTTGNGYFASWAGAVCACFAAFNAKNETGITTETVTEFMTPAAGTDGGTPTVLSATIK